MKIKKTHLITYEVMKKQYFQKVNPKNILHISKYSLWKIFRKENKEDRDIYLRNVVSDWLKDFEGSDESLFPKVKRVLRKTMITLTDIEKDGLFVLEERSFSEIRQIKIIEVNNKLNKGEFVGVKYTNAFLYDVTDKTNLLFEGNILISNRRIIFDGFDQSFRFANMVGYSTKKSGLEIKMKDGQTYLIRIHDTKTLHNTFGNIINRKVKNAIRKY